MKEQSKSIGETVAVLVQGTGAAIAFAVLVMWAWSLASGSIVGFVLLALFGTLFVGPIVAWGLPAIALVAGLFAQGIAALIYRVRSRA